MRFSSFLLASCAVLVLASCSDGTGGVAISGLRFVQQPGDVKAGEPFLVSVELLGADGSRIAGGNAVSLEVGGQPVSGTATVRASGGLATFSGVSVRQAGPQVQLTAKSGSATASSVSFAVTPGAAAAAQSTIEPSTGPLAAFVGTDLLFTFRDQFNNPVAEVPVTVASAFTPAVLSPSSGVTSADGTFLSTFRPDATGTATFSATVDGVAVSFATSYPVQDVCAAAPLSFPGAIGGTIPTGNCVIDGFPAASHRFSTTSEFVARFSVTAPFAPMLQISAHPPVDNVILRSSNNTILAEWLLPAGTYNARVAASSGTGPYSLVGLVGLADDGCSMRFLVVAATYTTQRLQADDCNTDDLGFFDTPDGSRADLFAIQSLRPCTITMRSSVMNSYLVLADWESLGPLRGDDNSGGGVNGQDARITQNVCASPSGPLVIAANHFVPTLGAYTLTIEFGPLPGAAASRPASLVHPLLRLPRPEREGKLKKLR